MRKRYKTPQHHSLLALIGVLCLGTSKLFAAPSPFSFSGELVNPNAIIPAGYYGVLSNHGGFGWQTGDCHIDVDTNGYVFTIDSGNGNPLNYSGVISGQGNVVFKSASMTSTCCINQPLIISGKKPNRYQGSTTLAQGIVELKKSSNILAIPGDVHMLAQGPNDALRWKASYQLNHQANFIMDANQGILDLNGYAEKIHSLKMVKNALIKTDSPSASGQLQVDEFWYDNVKYPNQVYRADNAPFIQGKGQLIVGPQLPEPYQYTTMQGDKIALYPYTGRHIALLVTPEIYDPLILDKIVSALDKAYDFYQDATGREPSRFLQYKNLATVAMVENTCGAGCGYLGATGIELQTQTFKRLFNYVKNANQYDQAVFYELGRNFWFYGKKIEYVGKDAVANITTGYAVFMRFLAMDAAGVMGAPFGSSDFETFRRNVIGVIDLYLNDPSLTWENTLKIGRAPKGSVTNFFASFMFRLECDFGHEFIKKFWHQVALQPNRLTTQDAVNNFIKAASEAAGEDLTAYFAAWRWPTNPELNPTND